MTDGLEGYLQHVAAPSSGDGLARLTNLAEEQARIEAEIKGLEVQMDRKRSELKEIAERQIPELADSLNIAEFRTASGLKIEIAETIRASIPVALAQSAYAWLRERGHSAMIKRTLSLAFGKGEDEKAEKLKAQLTADSFELDDKTAVNAQSLAAFVREKLRNGEEIPLDLFGVHRQRVSKITN